MEKDEYYRSVMSCIRVGHRYIEGLINEKRNSSEEEDELYQYLVSWNEKIDYYNKLYWGDYPYLDHSKVVL